MLTPERMEEIEVLVEEWEEKEVDRRIKEAGYSETTSPLSDLDPKKAEDKEAWAKAAREMGISPEELEEWDEQSCQEALDWNQKQLETERDEE